MKRILSILAAMVMILAAVPALGEEIDPIVGVWYLDIMNDGVHTAIVMTFDIYSYVNLQMFDVTTNPLKPSVVRDTISAGYWQQEQKGVYTIFGSDVGLDHAPLYLIAGALHVPLSDNDYWVFHKMEPSELNLTIVPKEIVESAAQFIE